MASSTWKDVGQVVGGSSTLIGKLLSIGVSFIPGVGPIIGPIIGPAVGNILAGVLGVPATPDAVAGAIASNPDDVLKAKLQAATDQIKAQYDWAVKVETGELHLEEVAIEQVNATMRAETASNEPLFYRGWRPFIGWVYGAMLIVFGVVLAGVTIVVVWNAPDPAAALSSLWPLYLGYFGAAGAPVGVLIKGRSDEKKAAIENGAPMPNTKPSVPTVASAIIKKK